MRSMNWTVSSTFSTVRFEFKRGALLSLDGAKNHDLIFVGSPSENLTLLDIRGTEEFVFRHLDSGPRKGDLAILNVHPLAGEPNTFLATPPNLPTTEDHAVVSLLPGLDPSLHPDSCGELHLGHTAVEYVRREDSVKELLQRLKVAKETELTASEASFT